jgi:hypothetical protein
MVELEVENVKWCKNMFALLAEGGVWGVPRSELIFQKRDGALWLVHQPNGPDAQADFEVIRYFFKKSGIEVKGKEG